MDGVERATKAHAYENPRPEVQALVPRDVRRILDLGCSSGALGAALKARGEVEIVGVEIDRGYARDASGRLDRVVVADVQALATDPDLEAELGRFDCLIAADVLEHLVDPWAALRSFARLLDPGCPAIVSLPNVRYWETFWQLGRHGTWPRRPLGVFDATHLRWFTLGDAHELLYSAQIKVETTSRQLRRPDGAPWPGWVERVGTLPVARSLLCLQYVLVGRKTG